MDEFESDDDLDALWKSMIVSEKKRSEYWYVRMILLASRAFQLQVIDAQDYKRRMGRIVQYAENMDCVISADEQLQQIDPRGYDKAWKSLISKRTQEIERR